MTYETAVAVIDRETAQLDGWEGIEFDLFGGEPFLQFELIRKITEYVCQKLQGFPHTVFLTTNGTLVHGEIAAWLKEHSDCVVCGLSLDGTRDMHNSNRSNSFDKIDLDFFAKTYPQQDIKMTVSQKTLPFLAEGVIFAHQKGFLVSCNLAYGIDWSDAENKAVLERELYKLIDYYLAHPEIEPCSMLSMGITNVLLEERLPRRFCGAGIDMRAYDIDGEAYPCQFFMPLSVGAEKAKHAREIVFYKDSIPIELIDESCKDCVINACCPNCYGSNYAASGDIYKRDANLCTLIKIQICACAYFYAMQWSKGQLEKDDSEVRAILQSVRIIQNMLKI